MRPLPSFLLFLQLASSAIATPDLNVQNLPGRLAKRQSQITTNPRTSTPLYIDGVRITDLVAFGDSMTDSGNMRERTNGARPGPPNWQGRYSDGPTWVEYFAKTAGTSLRNHAFAGARTDWFGLTAYIPVPGLPSAFQIDYLGYLRQVPEYIDSLVKPPSASTAHIVYSGSIDYIAPIISGTVVFSDALIEGLSFNAVRNIMTGVRKLHDAGARTLVVMGQARTENVPIVDLIRQDYGRQVGDAYAASIAKIVDSHNRKLIAEVVAFKAEAGNGTIVKYVDMYAGPDEDVIRSQPVPRGSCVVPAQQNGQNATYVSYILGLFAGQGTPTVCPNPQDYTFWDLIHPTTYVHSLVARGIMTQLNSTTVTGLIYGPSAAKISKEAVSYIVAEPTTSAAQAPRSGWAFVACAALVGMLVSL